MTSTNMLRHMVLCKFTDDASALQCAEIVADFAVLPAKIACIRHFEAGINNSPEGLSQGYTHCFRLDFDDEVARDAYLIDPAHLAFVERLKPWLAQVLVVDYWGVAA
jgi:hypothetical protein